MAQFGSQPGSWNWVQWRGVNTENQVAAALATIPEAGRITGLSCYFGGHLAAVNARLCVWDSAGTLLAYSAVFSAAQGSGASGGQAWQTQPIPNLRLNAGVSVYIGFSRDPAVAAEWSSLQPGTWLDNTQLSWPGPFTSPLSVADGVIGAYATYVPLRNYVRRSGVWVATWPRIRRSGVWVYTPLYVRRSGVWVAIA